MKRILFYSLILFQVIAVSIVVIQYNLIDVYGKNATFKVHQYDKEDEYYYEENIHDFDSYMFELEVNNISKGKWHGKKEIQYNDRVYVLLEENKEGIYEVVKATDKELTATKDNQLVLIGKEIYENDEKTYHVSYDFETINVKTHKDLIKDLKISDMKKVSYKFAPWNQSKLINIE